MLASALEYIRPQWEGPIIIVCILVWLLVGGYLFEKILGKRTDRRKYSFGRGVLVSFLSGAGGGMSALMLYFIGSTIFPVALISETFPVNWLGMILGIPGFFCIAYLIVFSMHNLSAKETLTTSILPIVLPFLFALVAMSISLPFSAKSLQEKRELYRLKMLTKYKMNHIHNLLVDNVLKTGKVPFSLDELVAQKILDPEFLKSPANPNGRGFFYHRGKAISDLTSREIFICDYAENFGDKGRTVLYRGGYVEFLPKASFRARLKQPENRRFAEALEEAEKK